MAIRVQAYGNICTMSDPSQWSSRLPTTGQVRRPTTARGEDPIDKQPKDSSAQRRTLQDFFAAFLFVFFCSLALRFSFMRSLTFFCSDRGFKCRSQNLVPCMSSSR